MLKKLEKSNIFYLGLSLTLFSPLVIVAAPADFKDVVSIGVGALEAVLPVIVLLAFIYFLWGLAHYIRADKDKSSESKTIMINGVVALFIISSVWGFVWILTRTFIGPAGANTPSSLMITDTNWSDINIENPL